jgi:hypothetical protein
MKKLFISLFIGLMSLPLFAGSQGRAPAHINPESTLTVPLEMKKNSYKEFMKDKIQHMGRIHDHLRSWKHRDEIAAKYDLIDNGIYQPISGDDRIDTLRSEALYFFKRQAREPLQSHLRDIRFDTTESEDEVSYKKELVEINSRKGKVFVYEIENNKRIKKESGNKDKPNNPKINKEYGLFKDVRLTLKPRLFKGVFITQIKSPHFRLNTLVGVNGDFEMTYSQHIKTIETGFFMNYSYDKKRLIANLDKGINENWSVKFFTEFDPLKEINIEEKSQLSLHFNMAF